MFEVKKEHCQEWQLHSFSADASELGLQPGNFPEEMQTSMGNGNVFIKTKENKVGWNITYADYTQLWGNITLRVFNT